MNKTIHSISVNGKTIVFNDDADLSVYPPESVQTFSFEFETPNTGDLIKVSDLILDFSLRRDPISGGYNEFAYRLAYQVSFARAVCSSIVTTTGTGVGAVISTEARDASKSKNVLDKSAVEAIPTDILAAFVQFADPTAVGAEEYLALKKMRVEKTPTD